MVIEKILIYPIKSLPGIQVGTSFFTPKGSLRYDRQFALYDEKNKVVNCKKYGVFNKLSLSVDLDNMNSFVVNNESENKVEFNLLNEVSKFETWFKKEFSLKVFLKENKELGFPDDIDAYGPTIVDQASLSEVGGWFDISVENVIERFRPNIITKTEEGLPFTEDKLFGEKGSEKPFQIGNVKFLGINPCKRCVVPARDQSGIIEKNFITTFKTKRAKTLPLWSARSQFDQYYRFCVNTKTIAGTASTLSIGDKIVIS